MDIGFMLKQFVTFFVEPLGMVLTLFLLGVYFLYKKKEFFSKLFLSTSFGFLLLFSYPPFSNYLIKNLENTYPKYNYKHDIKYIHVLGSGHNTDPTQSLSSQLGTASIKRVVEGIIIHRKTPHSKLIFTGYGEKSTVSTAQMHARLAIALGVSEKNIIINAKPKDTAQEAKFVRSIVGDETFVLVTSATHMVRSIKLMKALGLHPIPAPTNFYKEEFSGYFKAPTIGSVSHSKIAMHEYLGMLWNKIAF